jgi:hypothetical protein
MAITSIRINIVPKDRLIVLLHLLSVKQKSQHTRQAGFYRLVICPAIRKRIANNVH